jgi:hypothetical protein
VETVREGVGEGVGGWRRRVSVQEQGKRKIDGIDILTTLLGKSINNPHFSTFDKRSQSLFRPTTTTIPSAISLANNDSFTTSQANLSRNTQTK